MKPFNYLVAVFGLVAGAAVAQPPGPPPGGGPLDIERLSILLDLDAYQKGEVERVLAEQREAQRAARLAQRAVREEQAAASGEPPSRDEMRARREQNREELFGKLHNTLTEQQLTKLKVLMETPSGGRRGPGGPF